MHKNTFQNHTVGSCEMHPGSPICASRLVIHWQVPDLAEDDPGDSEHHPLCGKVPLKITKAAQKDVRHPWFRGGTQWGRSPQLRAALPWEATVLPAGGTFQGKQQCPKALGLRLCGWTSIPPSNVISCAGAQQKWSFPACTSRTTTQSRATISMSSTAVRALKACELAALTQAKVFLKTPKPKDVFNSSNKKQSSWNSATISCFRLKIKFKKISQALNKQ